MRPIAAAGILATGLTLVFSTCATADVVFSDGLFPDAAWQSTKIQDDTSGQVAAFTAHQIASGGNPGAYREVTQTIGVPGTITVAHLHLTGSYDPGILGALGAIDASYDLIQFNPPPNQQVFYGLLLSQGGTFYLSLPLNEIFSDQWTSFSLTGLRPVSFLSFTHTHPDFSVSGAPIEFGYWTSNTTASGGFFSDSGIDNWSVTAHTAVPELSSLPGLATCLGGIAGCVLRRRLRRR